MKKESLKYILNFKEQNKKNKITETISKIIKENVESCKNRKLYNYHVPAIIAGFPKYDIYELYECLKKYIKDDITFVNNQIIISWEFKKKEYSEIEKILYMINKQIERSVNLNKKNCMFEIPVFLQGIPTYDYDKTVNKIIKFLIKQDFEIERINKTVINISWIKKSETKNSNDSGTDNNNSGNNFKYYKKNLKKLEKLSNKFLK